ncbi:MAG: dinitrogenase iron-molybdenum cofactor [Thermoprotei archaeon]|nr:MAG: dinitrogenase iron-molybdenum cofactor [Thermoprotei archaeon]RLE98072.1 MAG: dinitrogenase iron-molybdenum cofactor [Thermoprotei archaeon]HDI74561.1 dinitrogenase iron-molybdenum cofactor [Thermoprotei archaeon]
MPRVAVPSKDSSGLESTIEEHFGRAKYFTLIEIEDNRISSVEVVENPLKEHFPGELPRFLKKLGVEVVVVERIGPRAKSFFESLNIKVLEGHRGRVKEIIEKLLESGILI